jgi:hypothetical protein
MLDMYRTCLKMLTALDYVPVPVLPVVNNSFFNTEWGE